MTIFMNDSHMVSIAHIKEFIKVSRTIEFQGASRTEKYQWLETVLLRFRYYTLRKKEKSILKNYMMKMTGYSDAQLTRLISRKKRWGRLRTSSTKRSRFPRIYAPEDIARLIETDNAHQRLSGSATKRILEREYRIFGRKNFERIQNISSSHIYNLRSTRQYTSHSLTLKKTNPVKVNIGERRKPDPRGEPGFIRVDTVHQGDRDKEKGVYHINMVDEVIQWEIIGCVEKISEYFLESLLKDLLEQYPFRLHGFHSDNGSEFINRVVAKLLNKLMIQQTKSRARHTNDNALTEGKNGSIIRKHMGYGHIPQRYAEAINGFYREHMNVYLNYHRPCGFATVTVDQKGKQKKKYKTYQTPYERLRSLTNAGQFLKDGVTFEMLDAIAYEKSDNECATLMLEAKDELFKNFTSIPQGMMVFTTYVSGSYVD